MTWDRVSRKSPKYEAVYLNHYATLREARAGLSAYFRFYNTERPPRALGHRTPAEVHEAAGTSTPAAA